MFLILSFHSSFVAKVAMIHRLHSGAKEMYRYFQITLSSLYNFILLQEVSSLCLLTPFMCASNITDLERHKYF